MERIIDADKLKAVLQNIKEHLEEVGQPQSVGMAAYMVRAILDGRKTVTRRVVKPQPVSDHGKRIELQEGIDFLWLWNEGEKDEYIKCPYRSGDILYVRETFCHIFGRYIYRADYGEVPEDTKALWKPSIHMPREAARLFLRVTNVRVERLNDITEYGAQCEGVMLPLEARRDQEYAEYTGGYYNAFVELWNSTIKPDDRALYGWDANPWVWVIEFERISREEAIKC